ncbi:hypothetical protein ES705_49510 [subsurface metagenome]
MKDYNEYTDEVGIPRMLANIWVKIFKDTFKKENGELKIRIEIEFAKAPNYKYLVDKIKQYCKKTNFSYNDTLKTYVSYYEHSDGTAFIFYEGSFRVDTGNFIIIFNSEW